MKMTYGEVPYPPGAGRVLTGRCVLTVEGPCERDPHKGFYVVSAWIGHVLIGWHALPDLDLARRGLLLWLDGYLGIKEQNEWPLTML